MTNSRDKLGYQLVRLLPKRALTRAVGVLACAEVPRRLRAPIYSGFATAVGADLSQMDGELHDFERFNAFFARPLVEGSRPVQVEKGEIASPADGFLSQAGRLADGLLLQAKGIEYSASELLGAAYDGESLNDAIYSTVYLSPRDYHRVHFPFAGLVERVVHIGGELWPVNGLSVPFVRDLFIKNERLVARARLTDGRLAWIVMVGATVVGEMTCQNTGVQMLDRRDSGTRCTDIAWQVDAGDEMGAFLMGSTAVIVVQDPDRILQLATAKEQPMQMGQPLWTR
jgi:phosphatidylserine decarboxylase